MRSSLAPQALLRHRNSLEDVRPVMAKADLKFLENRDIQAQIGAALGRAISVAGYTRKEAAGLMDLAEPQLSRWIAGTEHVQTARVMASEPLRLPFIEALARWAGAAVETTIRFEERRTA